MIILFYIGYYCSSTGCHRGDLMNPPTLDHSFTAVDKYDYDKAEAIREQNTVVLQDYQWISVGLLYSLQRTKVIKEMECRVTYNYNCSREKFKKTKKKNLK